MDINDILSRVSSQLGAEHINTAELRSLIAAAEELDTVPAWDRAWHLALLTADWHQIDLGADEEVARLRELYGIFSRPV